MFNSNQGNGYSISLDKLDLQIIEQLKIDARQPVRAIARNLKANRETVRYRLTRFESENILNIICVSNPERLGYQFRLVIGIRTNPGKAELVAEQLTNLPGIISVSLTGNRFNIIAWAILRDRTAFTQLIVEKLPSISNILSIEIMHTYHWIKEFWKTRTYEIENSQIYPEDTLSSLDLAIIKEMQLDPRKTITDLANAIGSSRQVASANLEKLLDTGIIGFFPIVSPFVQGYNCWIELFIKAPPDQVKNIAIELSKQNSTMHVGLITGQWQITATALFQNTGQLNKFTSEILSSIPGVTEFEVILLGKNLEFTTDLINFE